MDDMFYGVERPLVLSGFASTTLIVDIISKLDELDSVFAVPIASGVTEYQKRNLPLELLELKANLDEVIRSKFPVVAKELEFLKVWDVKSTSVMTSADKLPYLPHIDIHRRIKAMVYLTDVTLDDGPIHCADFCVKDDDESSELSRRTGRNFANRSAVNFQMTPMIGNKGQLVIFDTNIPHCAGLVADGNYRRVVRFDYHLPRHNPRLLPHRLIEYIGTKKRKIASRFRSSQF